ncbi:MAG: hypothetical protein H7841_12635 [Magnetospirillum sp. WYHS-4]
MAFSSYRAIVLGVALLLPACAFTEEALWPSLTGEDPAGKSAAKGSSAAAASASAGTAASADAAVMTLPQQEAPVVASSQPPLGSGNFEPSGVTPGAATGTMVGKMVEEMREELRRLQGSISNHNGVLQQLRGRTVQDSQRYHGAMAAINARLQVGTTRGNPILVQQFGAAQQDLDRVAIDVSEMNKLAQAAGGDANMVNYLSERTHSTFQVSGAVDEDHKQLAVLEDETNRTAVLVDRLMKEVTDDVRRQTNYIASERGNMNVVASAIKSGEFMGASLPNRAGTAYMQSTEPMTAMATEGRRPLVVIRFDKADVPYQQALYNAVSRVLERRPDAAFDLVAVTPAQGDAGRQALNSTKARRHADSVMRSLMEMGLAPNRVAVSGKTLVDARTTEVHLYVR